MTQELRKIVADAERRSTENENISIEIGIVIGNAVIRTVSIEIVAVVEIGVGIETKIMNEIMTVIVRGDIESIEV